MSIGSPKKLPPFFTNNVFRLNSKPGRLWSSLESMLLDSALATSVTAPLKRLAVCKKSLSGTFTCVTAKIKGFAVV